MNAVGRGAEAGGRPGSVPRITLMCITDGRWDYLRRTIASAEEQLDYEFSYKLLVDDSGSNTEKCPQFDGWHYLKNAERRGLAGAIQAGWDALPDCDYVFHLEDDFTFPERVPVFEMAAALAADPTLAQVALLRQPSPYSPEEMRAGSIFAAYPDRFTQYDGHVRQRHLFTFNPCLYPHRIATVAGLEQEVTERLVAEGYEFAYLGELDDPPRCHHIGLTRSAAWKL